MTLCPIVMAKVPGTWEGVMAMRAYSGGGGGTGG